MIVTCRHMSWTLFTEIGRVIISNSKIFFITWLRVCFRCRLSWDTSERSESLKASPHRMVTNAGLETFCRRWHEYRADCERDSTWQCIYLQEIGALSSMQSGKVSVCFFLKAFGIKESVCICADDKLFEMAWFSNTGSDKLMTLSVIVAHQVQQANW